MLEIVQARKYSDYYNKIDELNLTDKFPSISEVIVDNEVVNYCIYHYDNFNLLVFDYIDDNNDLNLLDGLIRSVLFLGMQNGVDKAKFSIENKSVLDKVKKLTYDSLFVESISQFMDECKNCKKD